MKVGRYWVLRLLLVLVALALLASVSPALYAVNNVAHAVYVLSNQASGNSVMVYARRPDGVLLFAGSYPTGGTGMGNGPDPLASQGSLVFGHANQLLFAVNAGSNDISVFSVHGFAMQLVTRVPSGGTMPVSIAVHGLLVYVLNAGGTPNIQGFLLNPITKDLVPLPGSKRNLPGGAASGAAEVAFSPDGNVLMVTEKGTNKIDTWTLNDYGYPVIQRVTESHGMVPFGFTFVGPEFAIVSEAAPSALSSYGVPDDGTLNLITGSLSDNQAANCWVVATRNRRYAFTTNTGSASISSYGIGKDGALTLLNATAGMTGDGTAPIDMALTDGDQFLYVRDGLKGMLFGFRVNNDGSLTPAGSASGIPDGAQGLAAN